MTRSAFSCCLFLVATLLGAAGPAPALWPQDGVNLAGNWSSPYDARVVPDGENGAIVLWWDWVASGTNVFAQRVGPHGALLWPAGGVALAPGPYYEGQVRAVSDGAGGAIAVWVDSRAGDLDVYAQRIGPDGALLWAAGGVIVAQATGNQSVPQIVGDGAGGAVIAWQDARNADLDIYAQRITAAGVAAWASGGVAICLAAGNQETPTIATDGMAGALVAWSDYRADPANADVYALRIFYSGVTGWPADGVPLTTATGAQVMPRAVSDGASGAIVTWLDQGDYALRSQRIDAFGAPLWASGGIEACPPGAGDSDGPCAVADGAGGAYVAWEQGLSGDSDVRAQRVTATGGLPWGASGVGVCTTAFQARDPQIVADGDGGAILAWSDYRAAYADIYAQRVGGTGAVTWAEDGVLLCAANYNQYQPSLASDGEGGALVAWQDLRDQSPRMCAQRVDRFGNWGFPSPGIRAARDVPGDEGGSVSLAWYASRLDPWPDMAIDRYTVWRAIPAAAKSRAILRDARVVTAAEVPADPDGPLLRVGTAAGRTFFWEYVGERDAYHLTAYAMTTATLFDSTAADPATHYFQVIAHAGDPAVFWISAPDSGRSVDNLAPDTPKDLAGRRAYSPAGLELTWAPNDEPDLAHYVLYRGADPGFVPGPGSFVATIADTSFHDADWPESGAWYKLTAVDLHGNEGAAALLAPDAVTAAGGGGPPTATRLEPAFPNPFNPSTRIAWTLAEPAVVSLRIHDAAGRMVRTVSDGPLDAGRHELQWNGSDDQGRALPSGVYYARLVAGAHRETRKLTLVK